MTTPWEPSSPPPTGLHEETVEHIKNGKGGWPEWFINKCRTDPDVDPSYLSFMEDLHQYSHRMAKERDEYYRRMGNPGATISESVAGNSSPLKTKDDDVDSDYATYLKMLEEEEEEIAKPEPEKKKKKKQKKGSSSRTPKQGK